MEAARKYGNRVSVVLAVLAFAPPQVWSIVRRYVVGLLVGPFVSPCRDFCEVVRVLKMKQSLYQNDFNVEPANLWIHNPFKADFFFFWCFPRVLLYCYQIFCRLSLFHY